MNINIYNIIKTINTSKKINLNESNLLLSKLNVGDILKGKILDITNNLITIEINNKFTLQAKNNSDMITYNIGDLVEFIIIDKDENNNSMLIKPYFEKQIPIDLKDEIKNSTLIEQLFNNEIPVTKENINFIMSTQNNYGKLGEIVKHYNISIDDKILQTDINKVLKDIIKQINSSSVEDVKNKINSNIINNHESIKPDNILALVNKLTQDKLIFILKNNLKFNLVNLKLIEEIIIGEKDITKQVNNLITLLKENGLKTEQYKNLLSLIKSINITNLKNKVDINQVFSKLYTEIENLKNIVQNKKFYNNISKEIENIKSSLDFLSKLNENLTFIQIPININNFTQNLDIYISRENKKNKKINKDNTKIFISLDTKNLNLVQVLIEISNKKINLIFKLGANNIKEIFRKNEKEIFDKLSHLGFEEINIKYNVTEEKISLINLPFTDQKKYKYNKLDLKV